MMARGRKSKTSFTALEMAWSVSRLVPKVSMLMEMGSTTPRAEARDGFRSRIVHTGQRYDGRVSDIFFEQLGLPKPYAYLGVGSGSHAEETGRSMVQFEKLPERELWASWWL